jgi:proteasome accessory factor C
MKTPQAKTPGAGRLLRLWGLLVYLSNKPVVPLDTLAAEFGSTKAQIRKDLATLAGVETPGQLGFYLVDLDFDALEDDGDVRMRVGAPFTVPMHLTTHRVAPLIAGLEALAESEFVAAMPERIDVVNSALAKLREIAGPSADALDLKLPAAPNAEVAQAIALAILHGQRLALQYVNYDDTVTEREVDPAVVVMQDRHAYLRGWCYFREEPRVFRLDRILDVEALEQPVNQLKVSAVTRDPDVAAEAALAGSYEAILTLSPGARWLAEELKGEVVELDDGNFELHLRVTSPIWLENLLLGVAPHVVRVEPAELAETVAAAAKAALANY